MYRNSTFISVIGKKTFMCNIKFQIKGEHILKCRSAQHTNISHCEDKAINEFTKKLNTSVLLCLTSGCYFSLCKEKLDIF